MKIAALLFLSLLSAPAFADVPRTYAVLVGVGDYLHLDADLNGPPHDVALMAETLIARGVAVADIVALGGFGLPAGLPTAQPTRAAILTAMQDTAARAASGDTVVFYFSGHGAQAPDTSGDEGGGYDEILLPADADKWRGAVGMVENALLDDELADWARPLLARGVRLVGIIDACHSATGFRALGGAGVARSLDPKALGLPDDLPEAASSTDPLEGEFVFLYSSQSNQRSFEYPYGDGSVWHGEFTLRLADVLTHAPQASWAQVLAAASEAMAQGPARQQPAAEGPLLAQQVFGTGRAEARMQVRNDGLEAGFLDGLTEGATVALFADAAGGDALAAATVSKVEPRKARLSAPPPSNAAWAEVTATPPPPLRLGAPVSADDGDYSVWLAALPPPVTGQADLVPILTGGQVALALPDGVLDPDGPGSTPRITPEDGEDEAEAVDRVLTQAAHAIRLRALLSGGPAKARSLTAKPVLNLDYDLRRAGTMPDGCAKPADPEPLADAQLVTDCDQLWITVTNTSARDQDVSILYLGADFSITPVWPARHLSNRLAMGEQARAGVQITKGTGPAREELWIIAVPAEEDSGQTSDLTLLATPQMTRAFPFRAPDAAAWFTAQMDDPANAERTRGFSLRPPPYTLIRKTLRVEADPT